MNRRYTDENFTVLVTIMEAGWLALFYLVGTIICVALSKDTEDCKGDSVHQDPKFNLHFQVEQ